MLNHYRKIIEKNQEDAKMFLRIFWYTIILMGAGAMLYAGWQALNDDSGYYVTQCDENGCYEYDTRV